MLRKLNPKGRLLNFSICLITLLIVLSLGVLFRLFDLHECICLIHQLFPCGQMIILIFLILLRLRFAAFFDHLLSHIERLSSNHLPNQLCSWDCVLCSLQHYRIESSLEIRSFVVDAFLLELHNPNNLYGIFVVLQLTQSENQKAFFKWVQGVDSLQAKHAFY